MEWDAVDHGILARHHSVELLQHLQEEAYPLLLVVTQLVVAQLCARLIRPDERSVWTQKTVVVTACQRWSQVTPVLHANILAVTLPPMIGTSLVRGENSIKFRV